MPLFNPSPILRVTSLTPGSGGMPLLLIDGMEVAYVADSTNGILWHLKYNAGSASAYKWEYLGGPPMWDTTTPDSPTASLTYAALGNAGPQITLPTPGDYMVGIGMNFYNTNAAAQTTAMSYDVGAIPASVAWAIDSYTPGGGGPGRFNGHRYTRHTNLGAVALVAKYRVSVGANGQFFDRWMSAEPIRLSA